MSYQATFSITLPDRCEFNAEEAERTIIKALEAFPARSVACIDEDHDEEDDDEEDDESLQS